MIGTSPGYVGRASVYGNLLPGRIESAGQSNAYCYYFGVENCLNEFQYLDKGKDYAYDWIKSENGKYVQDAIMVQAFFIGRIWSKGRIYLGTVIPGYGFVYYEDGSRIWKYSNNSYEVLICNPAPDVVLYDCSEYFGIELMNL